MTENPVITALIKAKGNFGTVSKDCVNPFHKSKYASLDAINKAVDGPLLEQGLTIIQGLEVRGDTNYLVARLVHTSGVYDPAIQESVYEIPKSAKPQEMGSAMTYGRRYNKAALLDIVADADDDGNSATSISDPQFKRLVALAKKNNWSNDAVKKLIQDHGFNSGAELTLDAYAKVCEILENKKTKED
jgi:hypothetical protein